LMTASLMIEPLLQNNPRRRNLNTKMSRGWKKVSRVMRGDSFRVAAYGSLQNKLIVGIGQLGSPLVMDFCLIREPCKKNKEPIDFLWGISVNFNLVRTFEHGFIFDIESCRSDQADATV
jgi:hypothetical protein